MLRHWQSDCINSAVRKYQFYGSHFFCQATPGAGKTVMAARVALELINSNMVDLVLCFSPSLTVAEGIKRTFSKTLNCPFNGGLGSLGKSTTYQSMKYLDDDFWETLSNFRVFVVFDEIHHCSGSDIKNANVWGQQIILKVLGLAKYTLAMSGTPWRSDCLPIVLAEYSNSEGKLLVDYQYTLKQAVVDKVCRLPQIVLVDNEHLTVLSDKKTQHFSSILEMIEQTSTTYRSILYNQEAMEHLLGLGVEKLNEIRQRVSFAGGLAVAASVEHAIHIRNILMHKYGQSVSIVTYRHDEPLTEIENYRNGSVQWIVSVGMVSEGTDIPRLQVCCHMSTVKTELYFRQVLGRILRRDSPENQTAWLFTFAEKSLIEFAENVEQDIPDSNSYVQMESPITCDASKPVPFESDTATPDENCFRSTFSNAKWCDQSQMKAKSQTSQDSMEEIKLGSFKHRVIAAFTSSHHPSKGH